MRRWGWTAVAAVLLAAAGIVAVRVVNAGDEATGTSSAVATTTRSAATTTAAAVPPVDPAPDTPTEVVDVVAVDAGGEPAAGYAVEAGSPVEGCYASEAAVGPNIVECWPSAAGANVCWVRSGGVSLLCGVEPWEKVLRRSESAKPVDRVEALPSPKPWGIELADGTRCSLRNGGSWGGRADGYTGAYSCRGKGSVVLSPPDGKGLVDRSRSAWTVLVGDLGDGNPEFPEPVRVRVATAYFAASA